LDLGRGVKEERIMEKMERKGRKEIKEKEGGKRFGREKQR